MRKLVAIIGVFGVVAGSAALAENNSSRALLTMETSVVLAQANAPAGTIPQPDFILNDCQETESTGDPNSAMRGVDPAYMLKNFLYSYTHGKQVADLAAITVSLLQGTTQGNLNARTADNGRLYFMYDPTPNYTGNDQAIFMAEFEGKRYKIVVELHVFEGATPGDFGASTCPDPQLIKVTKPAKPSSGSNGYDLNAISITLADLQGTPLALCGMPTPQA